MSGLQGAIQAPRNSAQQFWDDNLLLYNLSDAEIISVLGIGDGESGDNMKLVDAAVSCTNIVPVEFTNIVPVEFTNHQSTRVDNSTYVLPRHISTTTSTTQGASFTLRQAGVELQGTQPVNPQVYVSVTPETQVSESASDGSLTYVNLTPAQTQVNESASDGSLNVFNLGPAQTQVHEISSEESSTYINLDQAQTQVLDIPYDCINSPDEMAILNSGSSSANSPAFYVPLVNQEGTLMTEDNGGVGPVVSPGTSSPTYASSPSDIVESEGTPNPSPLPSLARCGSRTRQNKPKPRVQSSSEIDDSNGATRSSSGSGRSSSGTKRSLSKKRRPRVKKRKLYEQENPFIDPKAEKKRQDAINSKKNREKKKHIMDDLKAKVKEAIMERDNLKKEVDQLNKREKELRALLLVRARPINSDTLSV